MEVLQYLGKLSDGHEVVITTATYTPYVIVTNYNPDTMSWASAYGYYSNIGDMARAITELEAKKAKNEMIHDLIEFSNVYDRICNNYCIVANADVNFEDAFREEYPFEKDFADMNINYWVYMLSHYLKGNRKIGETEQNSSGRWYSKEDGDEREDN